MDDKNKKKLMIPEAIIIDFTNEEIITTSVNEAMGDDGTDNQEEW